MVPVGRGVACRSLAVASIVPPSLAQGSGIGGGWGPQLVVYLFSLV